MIVNNVNPDFETCFSDCPDAGVIYNNQCVTADYCINDKTGNQIVYIDTIPFCHDLDKGGCPEEIGYNTLTLGNS